MPIHLPPISRRRFLANSLAATAATILPRDLFAADKPIDPHSFALLADTHIAGDRERVMNGVHLANNLSQAINQVIALPQRPAATLINGDLAVTRGEAADYATLIDLLKPARMASLNLTLTLGNHDHRDNFFAALEMPKPVVNPSDEAKADEVRHASMIESPRANWYILDTLDKTNITPGVMGKAQLDWLIAALDKHKDKPAIIMAHHTHDPGKPDTNFGLKDTDALFAAILPRRQVKAYIHGHSHFWRFNHIEDLHIIGLPPTAYVFAKDKPNGWVHVNLKENGATFDLRALDPKHPDHGKITELGWR